MTFNKKIYFLILFCFPLACSTSAYALGASVVHDPINAAINKARAFAETAYNTFMKAKYVAMAKNLYDNYVESKKFYDQMRDLSKHEGGFLGYLHEYTASQFAVVKQEQIRVFEQLKEGDPNNDVDRIIRGYSKKLTDKINRFGSQYEQLQSYEKKMTENSDKMKEDILRTFREANAPMNSKRLEEIQTKLAVHQTQILMNLETMLRSEHLQELKRMREELEKEKTELVNAVEMIKHVNAQAEDSAKGRQTGKYKNPSEVFSKGLP